MKKQAEGAIGRMAAKTAGDMSENEQLLFENVYLPAFAEKCAAHGLDLNDPETLRDALDTTALVKQLTAQQDQNIVKSAAAELKAALGVPEREAEESWGVQAKEAAARLAYNPAIQQALFGTVSK